MGKGDRGRVVWKRKRQKKVRDRQRKVTERRRKLQKEREEKHNLMRQDQETLRELRSIYSRAWGNSKDERVVHGTRTLLVGLNNPNSMLGGKTALMMACETGSSELARDAAAIPKVKLNIVGEKDGEGVWSGIGLPQSAEGKTALDIAMELSGEKAKGRGKRSMIEFLEKIGTRTAEGVEAEGSGEADAEEGSASGGETNGGLRSGEESKAALNRAITRLKLWRPRGHNTPTTETLIIKAIRNVTYVDEKTERGETLLGVACMRKALPVVEALVYEMNADVNQICTLEVQGEPEEYSPLSAVDAHYPRTIYETDARRDIEGILRRRGAKDTWELRRLSRETKRERFGLSRFDD